MMRTPPTSAVDAAGTTTDVFAAARWLDELWNSTAKAVSPDTVEWQCATWGSGRGGGEWMDTALFRVVAETFDLPTWRNRDGRDELVVSVPLTRFPAIARLIDRLDGDPESWPWLNEDNEGHQLMVAAGVLGLSTAAIESNINLMAALQIE